MNSDFSFILEAGVNHDGNFQRAVELIHAASETGAHYIKFQTYTADKIAAKVSPSYWDLNEESTTSQIELFSKYDGFTVSDYYQLAKESSKVGIGFMTTCFDREWVDALDPILDQYKIASADITNFQLLSHIAKKGKPLLISTGAATFNEISEAVKLVSSLSSSRISLLHCVLNYPTSAENASLDRISRLALEFPSNQIGYSDHTKPHDSFTSIQTAYSLGARVFEKHFTWSTAEQGNDHYHSFDSAQAVEMISLLNKVKKLSAYDDETFLLNQQPARLYARRGLYAAADLLPGSVITDLDLIPLRPPLGPDGFAGNEISDLIGRKLNRSVLKGDPILKSYLD